MGGSNCACSNGNSQLDQAVALIMAQKQGQLQGINTNQAGACAGQQFQTCPPDLVGPQTAADIKSAFRGLMSSIAIAGVASGAAAPVVSIASNGLTRAIVFDDLVSSLASLDSVRVQVSVGTLLRLDFFGGRFARTNANQCAGSCGMAVCVGPIETVNIVVTNVSGAAFAATDTMTLSSTSLYMGEPGFAAVCGQCQQAGAVGGAPGGATF